MAENNKTSRPTASNKYSLYAGREEAVNWGQIAGNLTKGLETIASQREAAKQKILDDTNAAMTELSEIADLQSGSMNRFVLDGSDYSKNTLQANMDLVRRGILKPKDYMMIMQAQKDGYKRLSNYAKNYDAKYKEGMERIQNEDAAGLEEFFRGTGFSFGNVKNKKLWTDPGTGDLILVEMIEDPQCSAEDKKANKCKMVMPSRKDYPDNFTTPAQMLNMIDYKEDSRDLNEDVKNLVTNNLAEVITADINGMVLSGKDVTSIENFRQIFDEIDGESFVGPDGKKMTFEVWLNGQAKAVAGDPNAAAEYLFNSGQDYTFTMDPEEAKKDPKKILAISDGGPPTLQLTEKQKAEALRLAANQINSQLDFIVKKTAGAGQQESTTTSNQNKIDENINGYLKDINVALTGDDLTVSNAALEKLVQQRNEQTVGDVQITNVDITDDLILIEYSGGKDPVRIVRQKYGDDNKVSEQTSLPSDIAQLYDLLSPYGNKEGYDLSSAEVQDRVKKNVTLGNRGSDGNVGFERRDEKAATDASANKVYTIDGKDETIAQWMKSDSGGDMDETTAGNTDARIQTEMNKALNRFLSENDMKAFNNAGFSNLNIEVSGRGREVVLSYDYLPTQEQAIELAKEAGVDKPTDAEIKKIMETKQTFREQLGSAARGTTMEELASQIASGMNMVNKAANSRAGTGEMTFEVTYPVWLKQNPGKNYQDYLNR